MVCSTDLSHYQYGGGTSSVHTRMCRTEESHHISTDADVQYGSITSSVRTKVCSTGLPKLLRGLLTAVFLWVNDILPTVLLLLRFHPTVVVYPDVAEISLAC